MMAIINHGDRDLVTPDMDPRGIKKSAQAGETAAELYFIGRIILSIASNKISYKDNDFSAPIA